MGRLHEEVESALRKLDGTVAELDRRQTWRNILATMRRGPWILGGVGLLVAGLLLRRKGREIRQSAPSSTGRAVAAGSIGLLALLAKRWAKRLWAGQT